MPRRRHRYNDNKSRSSDVTTQKFQSYKDKMLSDGVKDEVRGNNIIRDESKRK
jgi:hypothetical protein